MRSNGRRWDESHIYHPLFLPPFPTQTFTSSRRPTVLNSRAHAEEKWSEAVLRIQSLYLPHPPKKKLTCWSPSSQCNGIRGGVFGKLLDYKGICALISQGRHLSIYLYLCLYLSTHTPKKGHVSTQWKGSCKSQVEASHQELNCQHLNPGGLIWRIPSLQNAKKHMSLV